MPTKILVINSSPDKNCLLINIFKELELKNFRFSLWSSKKNLIEQFKKNSWPAKKTALGLDLKNKTSLFFFSLILPFLQFKYLVYLLKLKLKGDFNLIICLNFNEKIIITGLAKILGIKTVWLETPDLNYRQINKFLLYLYRLNHKFAKVIIFNNFAKAQLAGLGFKNENLLMVAPGAKPNQYQENIFNKLAAAKQANFHGKYFTVGAIAPLNQRPRIEAVFRAIKFCLPVIPNLQLIIIGEGQEKKNLLWLAKQMEIENLVWLVGNQEQSKKWLENFDIYLAASDPIRLDDYGHILEAMASGLPVLAPRNVGLEDLVVENNTGYLIDGHNEMLSRLIIKLHQDKKTRFYLGRNGRERVGRFFTLSQMVAKMEQALK